MRIQQAIFHRAQRPIDLPTDQLESQVAGLLEDGLTRASEVVDLVNSQARLRKQGDQQLAGAEELAGFHDRLLKVNRAMPYVGLVAGALFAATASAAPAVALPAGVVTLAAVVGTVVGPRWQKSVRGRYDQAVKTFHNTEQQRKQTLGRAEKAGDELEQAMERLKPYADALRIQKDSRQTIERMVAALDKLQEVIQVDPDRVSVGGFEVPVND
ncbi:MAG: hypothetical protein KC910_03090 [Candidatus Eremiobacteraeota bacterium]|nr:hypothetical protein [Candidatus Eremiobacteraeota bacterium]